MRGGKHLSQEVKTSAVELKKAGMLSQISGLMGISEATLRRVLADARANPHNPIKKRKEGSVGLVKVKLPTLVIMKKHLKKDPTLTAKGLKKKIGTIPAEYQCQEDPVPLQQDPGNAFKENGEETPPH